MRGERQAWRLHVCGTTQILANVEEEWRGKELVLSWTSKVKEHIEFATLCGLTTAGSCHTEEKNLEWMLRDFVVEASRWNLVPKPASLWWTSTYDSEEKIDMIFGHLIWMLQIPFEDQFKKIGCAMNRQGK